MGIPAFRKAQCEFCNGDLDIDTPGVHQWTSGWVMRREGGGGHGISLPVREGRFAHHACVDLAARGHLTQARLL